VRIALGVEYNGAAYCGWQSQTNLCGVQDYLEAAIAKVAGHATRVHAAGRTDAGVHALMQVTHFDTDVIRPESAWVRGVNAFLPSSIRVLWSKLVGEEFHARFSAIQRSYQYVLVNRPTAPALCADRAGWYHMPLNISAMQEAIAYLQGEHDFSAFRASECQAKSPIKNLQEASIKSHGDYIIFNFSANAFLHHQVRNMVGALVYVGNDNHSPKFIQELLQQQDRTLSPPTFSPNGLYLVGVRYAEEWGLPDTRVQLSFI
jgi:tRNA pseudouridine38-40 synthase